MFQTTNIHITFLQEKNAKLHSTRYPQMPRLPKISNCNSASKAGTLEIWDKTSAEKKDLTKPMKESTPHSTVCSMIFFRLNFLNKVFSDFHRYIPSYWTHQTIWTLSFFQDALGSSCRTCSKNLVPVQVWSHLHGSKALSRKLPSKPVCQN